MVGFYIEAATLATRVGSLFPVKGSPRGGF
jgi:hypothetical protein